MPTHRTRIRDTGADRMFNIINYSGLTLALIVVLFPLIYIVSASFSSSDAVISGRVWLLPVEFTLDGYNAIFKHRLIWSGFGNSLVYASVGTLVNVVMTLLAAYPLSRTNLVGRSVIIFLFVFTMMFAGGIIPSYLLIKNLGLLNTRWALIIPDAIAIWNLLITITYFRTTIPQELLEAAQLDGCSDFQFVANVVLPLSKSIIAVIALFYAMQHWNQYFPALLYLKDQHLYPLQLVLRDILVQQQVSADMLADVETMLAKDALRELLQFSLIVVATFPVMLVYPFVQKHFVKGMMIGSLKG
ncbi:MAG: carbohydrate ABC transporter permease [bacterium]|nr:carbohydrate ABC transporter permease [bacterium]